MINNEKTEIKGWLNTDLQKDIWKKKYQFEGETLDEFFDRVSGGNLEIRQMMVDKKFLPGGRILASRGINDIIKRKYPDRKPQKISYSNCYVITPPDDSIEGIFDCAYKLARTYSYGGGCGIDISKLAPAGAKVTNAAKETSGAVSFMDLYSNVTGLISQRGRRGALMISMDVNHPDIERFIDIKNDLDKVTKANISIKVSDSFMNAVVNDEDWKLSFTREATGEVIEKTVKAKDLFRTFAENNWNMAEPGVLFWDNIAGYNLLSKDPNFEYAGVNPCAEEPLPAGGSCLLGSINLSEFVSNSFSLDAEFNWSDFEKCIRAAVRYLNEILDEGIPMHPLEEQRNSVSNWRQIGLGIMGLADMLIKMGYDYGSEESIDFCESVAKFMIDTAINESALLAKEFGPYPAYDRKSILNSDFFLYNAEYDTRKLVDKYGLRNSQLLTIAPTGTLSTMLGISGGIEPIFNTSYTRRTQSLYEGNEVFYKVYTPIIEEFINYLGVNDENELPKYALTTAMTLDYKNRVKMQAVWQRHIDASISSTVNVPESFTVEDVEKLYMYAWKNKLKGITIYRDNCKRSAILINDTSKTNESESDSINDIDTPIFDTIEPISRSSIGETYGCTNKYKVACGDLYITINRDNMGNIVETFVHTSKNGICRSNIDGINRMISLALRSGTKVEEVIDQLRGITCPACVRAKSTGHTIDGISCPDTIARALENEYKKPAVKRGLDIIMPDSIETSIPEVSNRPSKINVRMVNNKLEISGIDYDSDISKCPECEHELNHSGGCVICPDCGWSKCQ